MCNRVIACAPFLNQIMGDRATITRTTFVCIPGLKMKDAQGFCIEDAPPDSDEDGARAERAKFFE